MERPKRSLNLSEIHDCKKCHGKIVAISVDKLGNTYCGYCGERIDYMRHFKESGYLQYLRERVQQKSEGASKRMPSQKH